MDYDLLVIGGGINGVGIAADAAGRGLRVILCEMGDLASGTSSASSKLIHGGLRYLENCEFSMVHESLRERRILRKLAPHLIHLQPFVMPHCPWLRPYWLIRTGVFLYDHLAFDPEIPKGSTLNRAVISDLGLQDQFQQALQYYDCKEDDSRLVLHVALLAQQHGAQILTHTRVTAAQRNSDGWRVTLQNNDRTSTLQVKAIANVAGPWVQDVASNVLHLKTKHQLKLVKGSHLIVPHLFAHDKAFILQNDDGRVVFLIPYQNDFTLIGTTDVVLNNIEYPTLVSDSEIEYLCKLTNKFIRKPISPAEILHKYAGIRALVDDNAKTASKITRDAVIEVNIDNPKAPAITIFGGKITTYRALAERVGNALQKLFPAARGAWTANAFLPGGDFKNTDVASFTQRLIAAHPQIDSKILIHYVNNYGTRSLEIIDGIQNMPDLGQHFGALLYQREIDYLIRREWAVCAEDILWRRGKMGLWLGDTQVAALKAYIAQNY